MTTGTEIDAALRPVLPLTAAVNPAGHLAIGGCDALNLARRFGTPLYVFDEADLRERCREFRREFGARLPDVRVVYAAKAYLARALAHLLSAPPGAPESRVGGPSSHGNNKPRAELEEALAAGVGRIVIDNRQEIALLDDVAQAAGKTHPVLLRVTPDVDAP